MKTIPFVISMAMLCSAGVAAVIQADYQEDLDLPGLTSLGPRVEQSLDVTLPSASPQLSGADVISNPSNWKNSLNVSFNPTTDILSLTGDGDNDYQIITVTLSNLVFNVGGQVVTGITPISIGNAVDQISGDVNPAITTTPFFTANSFGVTYSSDYLTYRFDEFNIQAETDTFQVTLGAASVPEPGTLALTAFAAALLLWRRRRSRASVSHT